MASLREPDAGRVDTAREAGERRAAIGERKVADSVDGLRRRDRPVAVPTPAVVDHLRELPVDGLVVLPALDGIGLFPSVVEGLVDDRVVETAEVDEVVARHGRVVAVPPYVLGIGVVTGVVAPGDGVELLPE